MESKKRLRSGEEEENVRGEKRFKALEVPVLVLEELGDDVLLVVLTHCDEDALCNLAYCSTNIYSQMKRFCGLRRYGRMLEHVKHERTTLLQLLIPPGYLVSEEITSLVAEKGKPDMMHWLLETDIRGREHLILEVLAINGHLDMLKLMMDKGYALNDFNDYHAALGGHLEVVKWITSKTRKLHHAVADAAARSGNIHLLKWAHHMGCRLNSDTMDSAAAGGNMEILLWLVEQKVPCSVNTCYEACINGNLEVFKWLFERDCPCDRKLCYLGLVDAIRTLKEDSGSKIDILMRLGRLAAVFNYLAINKDF